MLGSARPLSYCSVLLATGHSGLAWQRPACCHPAATAVLTAPESVPHPPTTDTHTHTHTLLRLCRIYRALYILNWVQRYSIEPRFWQPVGAPGVPGVAERDPWMVCFGCLASTAAGTGSHGMPAAAGAPRHSGRDWLALIIRTDTGPRAGLLLVVSVMLHAAPTPCCHSLGERLGADGALHRLLCLLLPCTHHGAGE